VRRYASLRRPIVLKVLHHLLDSRIGGLPKISMFTRAIVAGRACISSARMRRSAYPDHSLP